MGMSIDVTTFLMGLSWGLIILPGVGCAHGKAVQIYVHSRLKEIYWCVKYAVLIRHKCVFLICPGVVYINICTRGKASCTDPPPLFRTTDRLIRPGRQRRDKFALSRTTSLFLLPNILLRQTIIDCSVHYPDNEFPITSWWTTQRTFRKGLMDRCLSHEEFSFGREEAVV
jgi:hypothetical protein